MPLAFCLFISIKEAKCKGVYFTLNVFFWGLSTTGILRIIECKTRNNVIWWHIRDTPAQCHRLQDDNELSIKVFDFVIDIFKFKIL